ncbi:isoprenylcysteine carboxylmethyltransferase family protein [Ostreiculturibacter nitratireducens]
MFDWPPVWLAGFGILAWVLTKAMPWPLFGLAGDVVGYALVALGIILMAAAAWQMFRARTTVIPHRDPKALVTGGVFRLSRNPIYLGDALVLAGLALIWDAALAVPLVPIFIFTIQHRFILGEEARLRAAFGAGFDAYAAQTRRWI